MVFFALTQTWHAASFTFQIKSSIEWLFPSSNLLFFSVLYFDNTNVDL